LHPRKFLQQTLDPLLIFFGFETADSVNKNTAGLNNRIGEHAVIVIFPFASRAAQFGEQQATPYILF
jgi:hypothetical protein